jgi:hypothetical protein
MHMVGHDDVTEGCLTSCFIYGPYNDSREVEILEPA